MIQQNFSQGAPFYIKTGEETTWNMDNISLEFGAGFRFNNSEANNTTMNWDQVDILKTGDGQGTGWRSYVSYWCFSYSELE